MGTEPEVPWWMPLAFMVVMTVAGVIVVGAVAGLWLS
jgi:hypothetical protein